MGHERLSRTKAAQVDVPGTVATARQPHVAPTHSDTVPQLDFRTIAMLPPHVGVPIEAPIRTKLERGLGRDLSTIRIHSDQVVADRGARAFTQGTDLFFAPGEYRPRSLTGQRLLAHELVHAAQQSDGEVETANGSLVDDPRLEAQADRLAARVTSGSGPAASDRAPLENAPTGNGPVAQPKWKQIGGRWVKRPAWTQSADGTWLRDGHAPAAAPRHPVTGLRSTPKHPKYEGEQHSVAWRAWMDPDGTTPDRGQMGFAEQIRRSAWARKKNHITRYDADPMQSEAPIHGAGGDAHLDIPAGLSGDNAPQGRRFGYVLRPETGNVHLFDPTRIPNENGQNLRPHHTTPLAGAPVGGAGMATITARGRVKQISDRSGHYTPSAEYTHQVVEALHQPGQSVFSGGSDYREQVKLTGYDAIHGAGKAWVGDHPDIEQGDIKLPADAFLQTMGNELQIRRKAALNKDIKFYRGDKPSKVREYEAPMQDDGGQPPVALVGGGPDYGVVANDVEDENFYRYPRRGY